RWSPGTGQLRSRLGELLRRTRSQARPVLGHVFEPAIDNEIGQHPDAIISYGLWKRRFAIDPRVIGRVIQIGDTQFQIIGVAERGFSGLQVGSMIDVWT